MRSQVERDGTAFGRTDVDRRALLALQHLHPADLGERHDLAHRVALEPRSVASFYSETMKALDELAVPVQIVPRPNEVVDAIPFAEDEVHRFCELARSSEKVRAHFIGGEPRKTIVVPGKLVNFVV